MATRPRNLRTGEAVWTAGSAPRVAHGRLARDLSCGVLIVGAGISGAMAAEALTAEGLDVALVDRRGPVRGSTAASTALLQSEIDTPLTKLAEKIGRARAGRAWVRSRLALDNLAGLVETLGLRCDAVRRPSLYLAGDMLGAADLEEEMRARRAVGLGCAFLSRRDLADDFGFDRAAALLTENNLAADPRRLAAGLLNVAIVRGAKLYAPVEIGIVEASRQGVRAETSDGRTIRAEALVYASGYEIPKAAATRRHRLVSTWAIATKPQKQSLWPRQAFVWEASEPYLYARTTADGRIVCGGEDEDFVDEEKRDALIPRKAAAIARKLARLAPGVDPSPVFAWTGTFGASVTGLPSIGAVKGEPGCYAIMGYGGNGITFSRLAAEILVGALTGRKDADAELFAFGA